MRGFTNADIDDLADDRGVVPPSEAEKIRRLRSAEMWERYDSIVVGEGAAALSRGWFNNWQDLAAAAELTLFGGREGNVGSAWTNQKTERTDYAQDLYVTKCEMVCPPMMEDFEENPNDIVMAQFWQQQAPDMASVEISLSDTDSIARAPLRHFPAGTAASGVTYSSTAAPTIWAGSNGTPHVGNAWLWPDKIMLAAKSRIGVTITLDTPIRQFLSNITGPGAKILPDGAGGTRRFPNWFALRFTFSGPRYVQLRGARSSA